MEETLSSHIKCIVLFGIVLFLVALIYAAEEVEVCGAWWLIGRFVAFRLKGCGLWPPRRDLGQVLHSQLPVALRCSSRLEEVL